MALKKKVFYFIFLSMSILLIVLFQNCSNQLTVKKASVQALLVNTTQVDPDKPAPPIIDITTPTEDDGPLPVKPMPPILTGPSLPTSPSEFGYHEGAPLSETQMENPCPSGKKCLFVDSTAGDNNRSGLSPDEAVRNLEPLKEPSRGLFSRSHSHLPDRLNVYAVLFKRGGRYDLSIVSQDLQGTCSNAGGQTEASCRSAEFGTDRFCKSPLVFGAYGPVSRQKPQIKMLTLQNVHCVTFRDLWIDQMDIFGSSKILLFKNQISPTGATDVNDRKKNSLLIGAGTYETVIAENEIFDIAKQKDALTVHDLNWNQERVTKFCGKIKEEARAWSGQLPFEEKTTGWVDAGPSHWIVGNVVVGNGGNIEDGLDVAIGSTRRNHYCQLKNKALPEDTLGDIKMIFNRVQMTTPPAYEGRLLDNLKGSGAKAIGTGHMGNYSWIYGNILSGAKQEGISYKTECTHIDNEDPNESTKGLCEQAKREGRLNRLRQHLSIENNIIFFNGKAHGKANVHLQIEGAEVLNNTILTSDASRAPLNIQHLTYDSGSDAKNENLTLNLIKEPVVAGNLILQYFETPSLTDLISIPRGIVSSSLLQANGVARDLAQLTFPNRESMDSLVRNLAKDNFKNPWSWFDPSFLKLWLPANCQDSKYSGALNCEGKIKPFVLKPQNSYCGWRGLKIIEKHYQIDTRSCRD